MTFLSKCGAGHAFSIPNVLFKDTAQFRGVTPDMIFKVQSFKGFRYRGLWSGGGQG